MIIRKDFLVTDVINMGLKFSTFIFRDFTISKITITRIDDLLIIY